MKTILQFIQRTLMVLLFSLLVLNYCKGQIQSKNSISITPIKLIAQKINVHYEREINKKWSGVLDFQAWFIDRKGDSFLERDKEENTNKKNNGNRYSFGVKRYLSKGLDLSYHPKFYVGLNVFTGKHSIEQTVYDNKVAVFTLILNSLSKRGAVDLTSSGVNINVGYKESYANGILIDFGVVIGKSWTNLKSDGFLLQDNDSTISPQEVKFKKNIDGIFIEPRLAVGILF